jgi:hypothetical protein
MIRLIYIVPLTLMLCGCIADNLDKIPPRCYYYPLTMNGQQILMEHCSNHGK